MKATGTSDQVAVTEDTEIEELIRVRPEAVRYLLGKGIRCVRCGEAVWGTLGELLERNGMDAKERKRAVKDINGLDG